MNPTPLDTALERRVAEGLQEVSCNGLVQISILTALMSSPEALIDQLANMSQQNPAWLPLKRDVESMVAAEGTGAKFKGLFRVVRQLRERRPDNWRLVIFTTRKLTQKAICRALDDRNIPHGTIQGGRPAENLETIRGFREEPPRYNVVVSTDAGAEGVNLQSGNVVVNFDLPWNPMIVEQRIGRVQRLASTHSHVVIVNMAVQGSAEARVVARLMEKLQTIVDSVGDIEAILEAASGDNDVNSQRFEESIRELVLQSLSGQDVEEATALAEKSIQDAKVLFESQREELDQTLGNLNDLHTTGPSMPQLSTREPAVPFPQFVERGLTAEGYSLSSDHSGILRASRPGRPAESITFDEVQWRRWTQPGVFQGKTPLLYAPGKPQFERLVQRWLDRGGHRIIDLSGASRRLAEKLLTDWLEARIDGAELESLTIESSERHFRGAARLKVSASNAVDSYEKIIDTEKTADQFRHIPPANLATGVPLLQEVNPESVAPTARARTEQECLVDSDIAAFCSFYEDRLGEELQRTGDDPDRRKKVESDLRPIVHADCITLSGELFESCTVKVAYSIDGHSGYAMELLICPASEEVFREDFEWGRCDESNREIPDNCLVHCECSQQSVLRHLTVVSDETGRRALSSYAVACPVTNRLALSDEFSRSDVSGREAVASQFTVSETSGRKGLPDEIAVCEFTQAKVLVDEVAVSELSRKTYRTDQKGQCHVSGQTGHLTEFQTCCVTDQFLSPELTVTSDVSQRVAFSQYGRRSEKEPHRWGIEDELAVCTESGLTLLTDEVAECLVTGRKVDRELLAASAESGELALPDELVECEVSHKKVLPDETVVSAVSGLRVAKSLTRPSDASGIHALPGELETCEVSGKLLLPNEVDLCTETELVVDRRLLAPSDISGQLALQDRLVHCAVSGRVALPNELSVCEITGACVLANELVTSDVSGKSFRRDQQCVSESSGRVGHQSESASCHATGRKMLHDELEKCEVSGKPLAPSEMELCTVTEMKVDRRLLAASDISGQLALQDRLVHCAVSGRAALPDELTVCEITGARVDADALVTSHVSGKMFRRDQRCVSASSGRVGHQTESATCQYSGRKLLQDETARSDVTGKLTAQNELLQSEHSGRFGVERELLRCSETGKLALSDEMGCSDLSGLVCLRNLLVRSSASDRWALQRELVQCEVSDEFLLPDEVSRCAVTGLLVDRRLLIASEVSGKRALKDKVVRCAVTGRTALPDELESCELSGHLVHPQVLETCSVTGLRAQKVLLTRTQSRQYVIPDKAVKCFRTGVVLSINEAAYCHWNDQFVVRAKAAECRRTGLTFSRELLSDAGEFKLFRSLLSGQKKMADFASLIKWLRKQRDGAISHAANAWGVESKRGGSLFLVVDLQTWAGFRRKNAIVIVALQGKERQVIGDISEASSDGRVWNVISSAESNPVPQ